MLKWCWLFDGNKSLLVASAGWTRQLCLTVWLYGSKSGMTEKTMQYCQLGNFITRPGCCPYPRGNLHWKPVQCSKVCDVNGRPSSCPHWAAGSSQAPDNVAHNAWPLQAPPPPFLLLFLSGQRDMGESNDSHLSLSKRTNTCARSSYLHVHALECFGIHCGSSFCIVPILWVTY